MRELVDGMLLDWGVSIRRACRVLPFDTSSYHYQSRRTDPAFLKKRINEICKTHVRYGYRRVYHIQRREGWVVNAKKVYRLYRELGLQLRNKTPKRWVKAKLREDRAPAIIPNDVWAMDFVHDQLATGRKLRILTVVDIYGIGTGQLYTWRKQLLRGAMAGFVPVEVMSAEPTQEPAATGRIDIRAQGGLTVSIDRAVDRTALKLALEVIGELGL